VINPSLNEGVLRQGWGYVPSQDLADVGSVFQEGGRSALSEDQAAAWKRVQRWWPGHWEPVRIGDRILLPKVPEWGKWALVEVTGEYSFEISPVSGDHGHRLPVKRLVKEIDPSNAVVSAALQRTMRNQGPMWNIDRLAADLDAIQDAGVAAASPSSELERLEPVLRESQELVLKELRGQFQANQLEKPVHRILKHIYPSAEVQKTAGPGERGADFLVSYTDPLGVPATIVIQLKDHSELLSDDRALDQIREAAEAYDDVTACVILTTAPTMSHEFAEGLEKLNDELGAPVLAVLGDRLAQLVMQTLGSMPIGD
jgi:hypothetical protein